MEKPQTTEYQDFYKKSRFELTFKLNVFLAIMLSFLSISFYFLNATGFYPTFLGHVICIVILILLKTTKKHEVGAAIFSISGVIVTITTLLFLKEAYHFVDSLWMIIISLFTYFTLGKLYGNITVFVQFCAIVYYILFMLDNTLSVWDGISGGRMYSLAINAGFCALVISYLINQFLKRNKLVFEQYEHLTQELHKKNLLVEQQNEEKTAMLKEIHHRVKNNLQVVTSLLRLQSNEIEDETVLSHFKEAIDRVAAMALIHNKMYQADNLNQIDLEAYLESLARNIIASYSNGKSINTTFNISVNRIPSNTIVPIALIFNELISNSIKHGFKHKIKGNINVKVTEAENDLILFEYEDDGEWQQPAREDSFGLELITTLVEQLNGTVTRSTEKNTRYAIQIIARE